MEQFLVAGFAVYRISRMIAREEGPFEIFSEMRGLIFRKFGPEHWIFNGFNCPLCLSFWFGLVASLLISKSRKHFILNWFGLSGLASFLYKMELLE